MWKNFVFTTLVSALACGLTQSLDESFEADIEFDEDGAGVPVISAHVDTSDGLKRESSCGSGSILSLFGNPDDIKFDAGIEGNITWAEIQRLPAYTLPKNMSVAMARWYINMDLQDYDFRPPFYKNLRRDLQDCLGKAEECLADDEYSRAKAACQENKKICREKRLCPTLITVGVKQDDECRRNFLKCDEYYNQCMDASTKRFKNGAIIFNFNCTSDGFCTKKTLEEACQAPIQTNIIPEDQTSSRSERPLTSYLRRWTDDDPCKRLNDALGRKGALLYSPGILKCNKKCLSEFEMCRDAANKLFSSIKKEYDDNIKKVWNTTAIRYEYPNIQAHLRYNSIYEGVWGGR